MVPLKDVQGRVYKFKSNSECLGLGIPTLVLPDKVRGDKVLVLSGVPRKLDYVKVMTITSTKKDDGDYVPTFSTHTSQPFEHSCVMLYSRVGFLENFTHLSCIAMAITGSTETNSPRPANLGGIWTWTSAPEAKRIARML